MKLQQIIRRILKEETTQKNIRARRRISVIDELIPHKIKYYYKPDSICRYESGEELLEVIMFSVIENMYWDYFSNIDDNSEEWKGMFEFMEEYIKDNYGDEIKKYYHINCGN